MASLLNRKRTLLAKIETVYGTDPVPTGGANAILTKNLNVMPMETNFVSRDIIRPFLGNFTQIAASIYAKVDFEVELAGSGTAGTAPAYGVLLRACGLSETISAGVSVTYAPISSSFESATIYFNVDGVLHKLTGCRGTVSLSMTVFGIPTYKFSFMGIYSAVTDTVAPTVTLTAFQTPLAVNNTNTSGLTLHGFTGAVLSDLMIDAGVTTVYRSLVGGAQSIQLTDRKSVGTATVEATAVAAKDWWTAASTAALSTLAITHGTTAGNKVTIAAPSLQIQSPTYSEKDMIQMLQLKLVLLPVVSNDEFSIAVL
jgi:hypothetical protein